MSLVVWTKAYRPFILGGRCNGEIATKIEDGQYTGPYESNHGIKLYIVPNPLNPSKTHIVEGECGAFVGTDINEVLNDINSADVDVMKQQIEQGKKQRDRADHITNEKFWSLFK